MNTGICQTAEQIKTEASKTYTSFQYVDKTAGNLANEAEINAKGYADKVGTGANSYADTVGANAKNYADTVGAGAKNYTDEKIKRICYNGFYEDRYAKRQSLLKAKLVESTQHSSM